MIPRYANARVATLWTDEAKVLRWDTVELALNEARVRQDLLDRASYDSIAAALAAHPLDLARWKALEKELNHDLGAFVVLRQECLPVELRQWYHKGNTSYDTEDPAFALALIASNTIVKDALDEALESLGTLALRYRHTPMLARTHGQWAKLCTFGGTVLTWYAELAVARDGFLEAAAKCRQSRLSGACGNYGGLSPELEREALAILGLAPLYGATQIMPRIVYAGLAQSLERMALVLDKIATDFRLGARSGSTLWQEPFGKKQKGSSAMPHKKNTITTEQMEGMARMASRAASSIVQNIKTWERRSIEQSCVERVEWPDLYHVIMRMLEQMTKVFRGMRVYPDHMLEEIVASRGTHASDEAKGFLAAAFAARNIEAETAYRIVQLAAFNALGPTPEQQALRDWIPESFESASGALGAARSLPQPRRPNIDVLIEDGALLPTPELDATAETVATWNESLRSVFSDEAVRKEWRELFSLPHLLKHEDFLFEKVLGF